MKKLLCALIFLAALALSIYPQQAKDSPSLEQITKAGNAAVAAGEWRRAESYFRQALELAPNQGFWRIQLVLVLGQQKKWKNAFEEMAPLARNGAVDWLITFNRNLPDGKVAFIDTSKFADERAGITRYVRALKDKTATTAITRDISVKFDTFADEHKIALLYDISKFRKLPFEKGTTLDVTDDYIAYYNKSEYTDKYYGTVYLYRGVDTQNYGTQIVVLNPEAVVFLDGQEFLRMAEKTFIGFKVPAGRYAVQMAWGQGTTYPLIVEPNGTYYLWVQQYGYPTAFQTIADVAEKTALEKIRGCYPLSSKKINNHGFETLTTNPNDKKE